MENILAPSILSANFADMASDFRILEKGGALCSEYFSGPHSHQLNQESNGYVL